MHLGLSESARVTTAAESRFRIEYPNSRPRTARIIAFDEQSFELLKGLNSDSRPRTHFLRYVAARPASDSLQMINMDASLVDVDGREVGLADEISDADVIVMVTSVDAERLAEAAEIIGIASFVRSKTTTGLVLNAAGATGDTLTDALHHMRPYAAMLVVSTGLEYIDEMLAALRA